MSRGLQNCNPGNIRQSKVRYKGEVRPSRDSAFKQFESLAWGYRAIFVLLDTYRIRYGLDTIRGMISRWAPPSENHTETYIRAVADAVGIPDGQPLDTRDRTTMLRMAAAVSRVETAPRPIWARWNWGGNCSSATSPHPADPPGGRRKETVNGDGLRGSAKNRQQTKTETPHPNITQNNPNLLSLQR